jgi:hypothetical protein
MIEAVAVSRGAAAIEVTAARASAARERRDEALARELERNAATWAALELLGVREGAELPVHFCFESAGAEADRELADYLRNETGYEVEIEPAGVSGRRPAMPLSPAALDEWVATMLHVGAGHGCAFAGWTVTVTR